MYVFTAHTSARGWLCCRVTTVGACCGLWSRHPGPQALILDFTFTRAFFKRLFGLLPDIWAMPA